VTARRPEGRELIESLVADLRPVHRFPRVGTALAIVLAAWSGLAFAAWRLLQARLGDVLARVSGDATFVLLVGALLVAALAGSIAAIASAVPGREAIERAGLRAAGVGLGAAVAAGLVATALGVGAGTTPPAKDLACFTLGTTVGLPPLVALVVLERWGFVQRPGRSGLLAVIGALGLGALAIQVCCHYPGARHMLLGHVGVPVVAGALLLGPVVHIVRRFAARRGGST